MKNTLYVSDLDGTLLHSNERLSEYTCNLINKLVEKGMLFSYATARSYNTASKVTHGLMAAIPLILYNGAFIVDSNSKELLYSNFFLYKEAKSIFDELHIRNIQPILYYYKDNKEKFSYEAEKINKATGKFIKSRKSDDRNNPVENLGKLINDKAFHFTCIGSPQNLNEVYNMFKQIFYCVYYREQYSGEYWLEIMPKQATKANAVLKLKELLKCDRVVVFGDGINDIEMFKTADECYAVKNAEQELKEISTEVILSNDEDGVARYLERAYSYK